QVERHRSIDREWKAFHSFKLMRGPKCKQHQHLTHVLGSARLRTRRDYCDKLRFRMELREFFSEDAIKLVLAVSSKDDILRELITLLKLDDKSEGMRFKMLERRETLGSTGIGRGIAIPHCRSLVVNKLRVAFGRKSEGVDFKAIDEKPVHFFFLIVAPPLE